MDANLIARRAEFRNKELRAATRQIEKCAATIKSNFYKIAAVLNEIDERRLYIDDGFTSVTEYAEKTFHMKKTACYNLIQIGRLYTAENQRESVLKHGKKDFSQSQLEAMLPLEPDKVKEITDNETITPLLSVRTIKEYVRKIKAPIDIKKDPEPEPEAPDTVIKLYGDRAEIDGVLPEGIAEALTKWLEEKTGDDEDCKE